MRIGAHVSSSGGLPKAFDRAAAIGAEAVQVFISSPQGWAMKPVPPEQGSAFRRLSAETGVGPTFLHAIYLVNLGARSSDGLERSARALAHYMAGARELGAEGVIFHAGSHKGSGFEAVFPQVVDAMRRVLAESPPDVSLVIENSAGMGDHIGASFEQLGRVMRALSHPQVKICLDTQHAFAAGYDVTTRDGLEHTLERFDQEVGLEHLVAVHANDSRVPFGAGVDRHENIGQGYMGRGAFEVMLGHRAFRELPLYLEVPGAENKGPDRENVEALKALRERALS